MVWAAVLEQQLYPLPASPDESFISAALGKIGESLANHASNSLNSADNITVTIVLLRHSSAPLAAAATSSRRPSYRSGDSLSEEKSSVSYSSRSSAVSGTQKAISPRDSASHAAAPHPSGAAEKRKTESGVSDDDLMRFLMDDSNF
jgi:hypothetical protein